MEVFISGSFTNWSTKILLIKSHNDFIAILDLPAGREPMQVFEIGHHNDFIAILDLPAGREPMQVF
ncbi:5'-AMP-activated protein kinase subunit beta-2 [Sciurus carolinensis]|uniref:5'-AMP-activated protein kinase subunit beta-2 n=1 Tax=Sciurus carolinensis TaxID=30640 RepID=A0AA41N4A3_SCICA|nr:5'-AMP-activated protein kinase subunit beta-2 [Sciurus carolinensis]